MNKSKILLELLVKAATTSEKLDHTGLILYESSRPDTRTVYSSKYKVGEDSTRLTYHQLLRNATKEAKVVRKLLSERPNKVVLLYTNSLLDGIRKLDQKIPLPLILSHQSS